MFSVGADAGIVHPVRMLDGGFFLPLLVVNKLVDFGGVITRGCHKMFSVGADAGIAHNAIMNQRA